METRLQNITTVNNQDSMDRATVLAQYTVDRHTCYYNQTCMGCTVIINNSFMLLAVHQGFFFLRLLLVIEKDHLVAPSCTEAAF